MGLAKLVNGGCNCGNLMFYSRMLLSHCRSNNLFCLLYEIECHTDIHTPERERESERYRDLESFRRAGDRRPQCSHFAKKGIHSIWALEFFLAPFIHCIGLMKPKFVSGHIPLTRTRLPASSDFLCAHKLTVAFRLFHLCEIICIWTRGQEYDRPV